MRFLVLSSILILVFSILTVDAVEKAQQKVGSHQQMRINKDQLFTTDEPWIIPADSTTTEPEQTTNGLESVKIVAICLFSVYWIICLALIFFLFYKFCFDVADLAVYDDTLRQKFRFQSISASNKNAIASDDELESVGDEKKVQ